MAAHPLVVEASEYCEKNRRRLHGLAGGTAGGFLTKFMEINREKALNFFEEIMSGEMLVAGDPAYEMREFLYRYGTGDRRRRRWPLSLLECLCQGRSTHQALH